MRVQIRFNQGHLDQSTQKLEHQHSSVSATWLEPNPLKDIHLFTLDIEPTTAEQLWARTVRPQKPEHTCTPPHNRPWPNPNPQAHWGSLPSSSIPSRTLLRLGIINTVYKIWQKDEVTFLEVPVSHPGCSGRWPPAQRSLLSAHPSASPAPRLSAGCSATLSSMWPRFHLGPSPARSAWLLPPRHASPAPLWLSSQPTVKGSIESLIISTKISMWRF